MILKYLFDKIAAFAGLLLLSPLLLIVSFLIKISMPGSIFFIQNQVGKEERLCQIVKFPSMQMVHNGSSVSVKGESRITPLGTTLRKYKLDELLAL